MPKLKTAVAVTRFNSFEANVPLLYLLKTSENERFSDIFMGYQRETDLKWVSL